MNLWDWLIVQFSGSTIGVLGQRAAGKTTLHQAIRNAPLPNAYKPTVSAQALGRARGRIQAMPGSSQQPQSSRIALREGNDVPGDSKLNAPAWKDLVLTSDVILYLFDARKLVAGDVDHAERFRFDCELISHFLNDRSKAKAEPAFALVGTHGDLDPTYQPPNTGSPHYDYWYRVRNLPTVDYGVLQLGAALPELPRVVVGSLKTAESAADLAFRVFKQELKL